MQSQVSLQEDDLTTEEKERYVIMEEEPELKILSCLLDDKDSDLSKLEMGRKVSFVGAMTCCDLFSTLVQPPEDILEF